MITKRSFLSGAVCSIIVGYMPSGIGSNNTNVPEPHGSHASVFDFLDEAQRLNVALRLGTVDTTQAIRAACTSGAHVIDFGKDCTYLVNLPEGEYLGKWDAVNGVELRGEGVVINNPVNYVNTGPITPLFWFQSCINVRVVGINYEGHELASPNKDLGYLGATIVYLTAGTTNVEFVADIKHCRHGLLSGNYSDPSLGGCRNVYAKLSTDFVGYSVAVYFLDGLEVDVVANNTHRACYIAGVAGFQINARFKNQYIAPIQVLITDAKTGIGSSRGSSFGKVRAIDMGSTTWVNNSWCCGISPSRMDSNTRFYDIDFEFYVEGNDTAAATLGGFFVGSVVKRYQPSYQYNWEQTFFLENIKVSGVINRSAQTSIEHGVGEIYMNTLDKGAHYATVSHLKISDIIYLPGSGYKPRGFWFVNPGLSDTAEVNDCDFGIDTPTVWTTNNTSLSIFKNVRCKSTYSQNRDLTDGWTNDMSRIHLVNCVIFDGAIQPRANVTMVNTVIGE